MTRSSSRFDPGAEPISKALVADLMKSVMGEATPEQTERTLVLLALDHAQHLPERGETPVRPVELLMPDDELVKRLRQAALRPKPDKGETVLMDRFGDWRYAQMFYEKKQEQLLMAMRWSVSTLRRARERYPEDSAIAEAIAKLEGHALAMWRAKLPAPDAEARAVRKEFGRLVRDEHAMPTWMMAASYSRPTGEEG